VTVVDGEPPARRPMERDAAMTLTNQIRAATRQVCLLLLEAHERRAWVALGYRTWEQYVQSELSISRSRSYELLDQARVVLQLRDAAGVEPIPQVSAYLALRIKPRLGQITDSIRQRVQQRPDQNAVAIVATVLDEQRQQIARRREVPRVKRDLSRILAEDNLSHLSDAIELLSSMPPPDRIAALIEDTRFTQGHNLEPAVQWLNEFVAQWNGRRSDRTAHG